MKKNHVIILCTLFACVMVLGIYFFCNPKQHIIHILERNIDTCTTIAEGCLLGDFVPDETVIQGVKEISTNHSVQVDFTCSYRGFGSQTSYYGFYYSLDNSPRTFQGVDVTFREHQKGLMWKEADGDNWCYVERIRDHWYYFEMHF